MKPKIKTLHQKTRAAVVVWAVGVLLWQLTGQVAGERGRNESRGAWIKRRRYLRSVGLIR